MFSSVYLWKTLQSPSIIMLAKLFCSSTVGSTVNKKGIKALCEMLNTPYLMVFFFFSLCAAVILFFSREENKTPSLKRCVCSTAVALNSSAQDLWDPIALCFAGHRFNWWKALSVKILFFLRTRAGILFKVLFKKK